MAEKTTIPSNVKQQWSTNKEDYHFDAVIGHGATSVVQRATYGPTKKLVAVKRINLEGSNTSMDELLKEIQVMSQCQHENVVQYYRSFVVKEDLWIVMQLCEKGSLLDVIKHKLRFSKCKNGVLNETQIATVMKEVLKALEYFHSNGQIHRDIKAGNILVGADGTVRLADFGVSSFLAVGKDKSRDRARYTFVGTPCWMAPEVMEQVQGYDYKADIWSFGITAIELATGTAPYHKFDPLKVLLMTLGNEPPTLDTNAEDDNQYKNYGKLFRKMVSACLKKDPAERPTAKELLKFDFFTKKAKDKAFLLKELDEAKYMQEKAVKRVPGSSGRLRRTADGTWEWSDDEDDMDDGNDTTPRIDEREKLAASVTEQPKIEDRSRSPDNNQNTIQSSDGDQGNSLTSASKPPESSPIQPIQNGEVVEQMGSQTTPKIEETLPNEQVEPKTGGDDVANKELHLRLRLRNEAKELHDIKFDFTVGHDTSNSISEELVEAGLVEGSDRIVVACNLDKAVASYTSNSSDKAPVVFRLNSTDGDDACEKSLIGYAQISMASRQEP